MRAEGKIESWDHSVCCVQLYTPCGCCTFPRERSRNKAEAAWLGTLCRSRKIEPRLLSPIRRYLFLWRMISNMLETTNRRSRNRVFVWNRNFAQRQRLTYRAEDNKLTPEPHQTVVEAFLRELRSRLDPPQYNYAILRKFLEQADFNDLIQQTPSSRYTAPLVLLDDRCDDTGWRGLDGEQHSARNWEKYASYPPVGSRRFTSLMDAGQLYQRQMASVSHELSWLKRKAVC